MEELRKYHEMIADHYTQVDQWAKLREEMQELDEELLYAEGNKDDPAKCTMTDNTWNEIADVANVLAEIVIQHGKEDEVETIMKAKSVRQIERIEKGEGRRMMKYIILDRCSETEGKDFLLQKELVPVDWIVKAYIHVFIDEPDDAYEVAVEVKDPYGYLAGVPRKASTVKMFRNSKRPRDYEAAMRELEKLQREISS